MQLPARGEEAPNFNLKTLDGRDIELSAYKKPVALTFLRHLACIPCSEHLVDMHQPEVLAELDRLDAELLVLSFAPTERFKLWPEYWRKNFLEPRYQETGKSETQPFRRTTFVHDPALQAYHRFGLGRFSTFEVYGPEVLLKYAGWFLEGKKIKQFKEDALQRGGDFVVGADGRIVLAHTGRNPVDRPGTRLMLEALRRGRA